MLASSWHNGNLDFSGSPNTSMRDELMNSEACLFGKWFVTLLQEDLWDRVCTRMLKHKIANPLFAMSIGIKVGAMQVEHLLEALHLLKGER